METPEFTFRQATPADAAALAELAARIFWETFAPDNDHAQLTRHVEGIFGPDQQGAELADPEVLYLIVDRGSTPVAYAMLHRTTPAGIGTGPAVFLHRFYVDRPWQGRGLAGTLLARVEKEARSLGGECLRLTVWERNHRAIGFYRKSGFVAVGSAPYALGDEVQTDVVMEKSLASAGD